MAIEVEGQVGPKVLAEGANETFRQGRTGEMCVGQTHADYYEPASRSAMYSGAIVGQVTTVGLATTYTGLCLSNPNGSPVNIAISQIGYGFTVAFAAASVIGVATGYSTTNVVNTVAVTARNQFFAGNAGGSGLLASSATLPVAPTVNTIFDVGLTSAITGAVKGCASLVDLRGSIVLKPGAFAIIYTSTASGAAGGNFSITWEEIPNGL